MLVFTGMKDLAVPQSLEELWSYTTKLHKKLYPDSPLAPILAGGKLANPKVMFVFINPTYRNVSSDPAWEGKRRPWTGTKYIWKILNTAGHFDDALLKEIQKTKIWDVAFADKVYDHLADRGFYFTNIVKWTGETGDLPDATKVQTFLPILLREIELVNPEYIVTFGLIPFNALVKEPLKLCDYYDESIKNNRLRAFDLPLSGKGYKVIPCYFPVGRGDPKRAADLLKLLAFV
jgi:uracil-DNA glycosylase